ncbi:Uncharacterized protein APZ42_029972 [Daphnia magna]|uniref:Transposable element P transposase-like GTP-binding insertion domain-containing protein n=1 Tax=Daphnia magna TaxID=35525 RepID=A0A164P5V1_9CRUS|nr:Uncharacterized protein APZ42_029972 [Daphnia magna]
MKNSIKHPTADTDIYFLRDAPHLFKCIRNHIFNHKDVQASGKTINSDLLNLFKHDTVRCSTGLSVVTKLKPVHLNPNSFQKMSVKLAVQVLSNSVADGLKRYRLDKNANLANQFKNCEPLENLVRLLNDSFDVMNSRRPIYAIRKGNWNERREVLSKLYQCLEETELAACGQFTESELQDEILLTDSSIDHELSGISYEAGKEIRVIDLEWCSSADALNLTDMKDVDSNEVYEPFLSTTTMNGLRVTIFNTIDVVNLLLDSGYNYVLTGKLNQDCIERFFGIIRMSGRCGDKLTVTSFLELFRLLTLYYPTKQILSGSNCDDEEKNVVLTTYSSWVKSRFNQNQKQMKERKQHLRDILLKGIERELTSQREVDPSSEENVPEEIKVNVLDSDIIYYICGYIVHAFRKKGRRTNSTFCKNCLSTVDVSIDDLPHNFTAAMLTNIKNRGKLMFSSYNLFNLLCEVIYFNFYYPISLSALHTIHHKAQDNP